MASFVNSFAVLEGDGEPSTSTTTGKKKKSKKNKRSASAALPPSGANEAVAPTTPAAAPAPEEDNADDGFQLAGRLSRRSSTGSAKPSTPASTVKQCTLEEGVHALEVAARETHFTQSADRVSQWKSWLQRVTENMSPPQLYKALAAASATF